MNSEKRRGQIIKASTAAFAKYGYEKTSVSSICRFASISRPTFYQYFKDKDSLFREIATQYAGRIETISKVFSDGDQGISPEELLYRKHLHIYKEVLQNKDIFRIILREADADRPHMENFLSRFSSGFKNTIKNELQIRSAEGLFDCRDYDFAASFAFGSVSAIIRDFILNNAKTPDIKTLARKTTDMQLAMFKSGAV